MLRSVSRLRLKCPKLTLSPRFSLQKCPSIHSIHYKAKNDNSKRFWQQNFSLTCSVWALTVAPPYCLVAVRWGNGAATDPELASWAEVKPRGPEGKVGWRMNPETREASTSRVEVEMVRWLVGMLLVVAARRRQSGKLLPTEGGIESEQPAPAPLSLFHPPSHPLSISLHFSICTVHHSQFISPPFHPLFVQYPCLCAVHPLQFHSLYFTLYIFISPPVSIFLPL